MRETTLSKTELRQHLKFVLPIAIQACDFAAAAALKERKTLSANTHLEMLEKCNAIRDQLKRDEANTTRRTL